MVGSFHLWFQFLSEQFLAFPALSHKFVRTESSSWSNLRKGLFVWVSRETLETQICRVVCDAFFPSWSSLPQITFDVTMNLLGLWLHWGGRSVSRAVPLKPMPVLLEVTLAPYVQASFVLQRAFLFNTMSPHDFLDSLDFPSHNGAN